MSGNRLIISHNFRPSYLQNPGYEYVSVVFVACAFKILLFSEKATDDHQPKQIFLVKISNLLQMIDILERYITSFNQSGTRDSSKHFVIGREVRERMNPCFNGGLHMRHKNSISEKVKMHVFRNVIKKNIFTGCRLLLEYLKI